MDRKPRATDCAAGIFLLCGAMLLASPNPASAQSAPPAGSTINGAVPTVEGGTWGGFDHQPTEAEAPPISNPQQAAKVNRKLNKLDQQLLNYPLPKLPDGAPSVSGN